MHNALSVIQPVSLNLLQNLERSGEINTSQLTRVDRCVQDQARVYQSDQWTIQEQTRTIIEVYHFGGGNG